MKTNIKMRVTPEQSKRVQEICFENKIFWIVSKNTFCDYPLIYIKPNVLVADADHEDDFEEIDADLFIRTNGTCEEISDEGLSKIKAASEGKSTEYLQEKIINLHKQINKDRATIKNQKEELHKLNLKLQKCISLEEHRKVINWHIERNQSLFAEIDNLKVENKSLTESSKISCNMLHSQKDKIGRLELNYVMEQSNYKKEIEKLKAVIEYLESKVK